MNGLRFKQVSLLAAGAALVGATVLTISTTNAQQEGVVGRPATSEVKPLQAEPIQPPQARPTNAAPAAPADAEEAGPGLAFETLVHNYGTVQEGELVNASFEFTNTSDHPITITNVQSTCGCTAANQAELQGKVIAPGMSDKVELTFNSRGRVGHQLKNVNLMTDNPRQPQITLTLDGNVIREVMTEPQILVFGDVMNGTSSTLTFQVIDLGERPVNVESVQVNVANMKATAVVGDAKPYKDEATGKEGRAIPVAVTLPDSAPAGRLMGSVTVKTNSEKVPTLPVQITGRIRNVVEPMATTVWFGVAQPGETKEQVLVVEVANKKDFTMSDFELQNTTVGTERQNVDDLELTVKEGTPTSSEGGAAGIERFNVTVKAPTQKGPYRGTLVVRGKVSGLEEETQFAVPFSFVVTEPQATGGN